MDIALRILVRFVVSLSLAVAATTAIAASASVLFIAGQPSHGPGEHEFPAGCMLLADALNQSGLALHAEVSVGWPDEAAIATADSIVIYSDGQNRHVAKGHVDDLRRHVAAGKGLAVMHYAVEPSPGELADFLLENLGGRFETEWSVNPVWTLARTTLGEHAVTRGVQPFELEDEWYYHLRFRSGIVPVLQAVPPGSSLGEDGPRSGNPTVRAAVARGEPQTIAWIFEHAGHRAFGFTGAHFHRNWTHDDFRRLVLNAIVWTARVEIPAQGIATITAPEPRHPTIDEAIARNDLADVRLHLVRDPATAQHGANPSLTPLHQAILRNRPEIALLLLENGADPNQADGSRRTPLHLAVLRGNVAIVTALFAQHAAPDALDQQGWTPLHHAAARNDLPVAQALLHGGANVNQRSELGGTPLHEAAASGGTEMVRLLLDAGVDRTVVSKTGATALDIAREFKNEAAINILHGN